ncbi:MAG: YmdB family metallophosphoesterase [Spirochaetaceae bacterium]|nr:MAG: YmdB family metallophosphoesterase [Spirochaetaceae bacterium]
MENMRILFIGEIVGKCGVFCVKQLLPKLKKEMQIDFVIASGDGATGGFGLGKNHSAYLHKIGINVITGGECIYYKRDMVEHISHTPYILRPANYPHGNPGRGHMVYDTPKGKIGVISLLGQSGFDRIHLSNPYHSISSIIERMQEYTQTIICDFHAATTSEKNTMFHHMAGKITAVIGTHAKALTSDARIIKERTAVISDTGRTGNSFSVGGLDSEIEIRKFLTQIPEYSNVVCEHLELQGVLLEVGEGGRAISITPVKQACGEVFHDNKRDSGED